MRQNDIKKEELKDNKLILLTQELLNGGIDFTLSHYSRTAEGEPCLIAMFYSKELGHNIAIDEEFPMSFPTPESFMNYVIGTQKKCMVVRSKYKL